MKKPLTKGLIALSSAVLTFAVAKVAFGQDSSTSSQALGSVGAAQNNGSQPFDPSFQPVLAVAKKTPSSGRATVKTEDGLLYSDFVVKPFEVKKSNERHGWTVVDARKPEHLDLLSHNDIERERHADENFWVSRRELVYRNETLLDSVRTAQGNNEELKEIILPGFDGEEYRVEVIEVDDRVNEEGIQDGSIFGRLVDDPNSTVHLGYYDQRESGGIISDELGIYLSYDPRQDGQLIIKEVDNEALDFAFEGPHCTTDHGSHEVGEPNAEL